MSSTNLLESVLGQYSKETISAPKRWVMKKFIDDGNTTAHSGDAIIDASVYLDPNGRKDFEGFKTLYGVLPEDVERISEPS